MENSIEPIKYVVIGLLLFGVIAGLFLLPLFFSAFEMKGSSTKLELSQALSDIKDGKIELQGDHKNKVKDILVKMGFPADLVEVK